MKCRFENDNPGEALGEYRCGYCETKGFLMYGRAPVGDPLFWVVCAALVGSVLLGPAGAVVFGALALFIFTRSVEPSRQSDE